MADQTMTKVTDPSVFRPIFPPSKHTEPEPSPVRTIIDALKLESHGLGGYFASVDRSPLLILPPDRYGAKKEPEESDYRHLYSSIMHLLTAKSPNIYFHRNLGTAIHTLHEGRARYAVIRMDMPVNADGFHPIEVIDVGKNLERRDKIQWTVAGGNWKVGWLLPTEVENATPSESKMLISEVVTPGFDLKDFALLTKKELSTLVSRDMASAMEWLISP